MKKKIDLITSGYVATNKYGYTGKARKVRIPCEVDLDVLSPAAKVIAENIATTSSSDDLSSIWVEGPSLKELAVKEGKEKECAKMERFLGKGLVYIVEDPTVREWPFDYLRGYETPEGYFERQAKEMKENGWLKIKRSTFNENIDFAL